MKTSFFSRVRGWAVTVCLAGGLGFNANPTSAQPRYTPVDGAVDVPAILPSAQSISSTDQLDRADPKPINFYADYFRISVAAAGQLEVTMDSGDDLDTYLKLCNASGEIVAANDDDDTGVLGVGSRITYGVTTPGIYYIVASTFGIRDVGNYNLNVSSTPAQTGFVPTQPSFGNVVFQLERGEAFSYQLAGGNGDARSNTLTYSVTAGNLPSGLTVGPNGLLSGTPQTLGVTTATIQVNGAASGSLTIEVVSTKPGPITVVLPTASTPGSLTVERDISFSVTTAGDVFAVNLDEWVADDGSTTELSVNGPIQYTLNGASGSIGTGTLYDDNISAGNITVNDGNLAFLSTIPVAAGDTFVLKSGSYVLPADLNAAAFNPQGNQTFAGKVFLNDSDGARLSPDVQLSPIAPTVTSPTSANTLATGALLGGTVTSDGGANITERGVVVIDVGSNGTLEIGGDGVSQFVATPTTTGTGVFTVAATGLSSNKTYAFSAYATNAIGTSYSPVATFTTTPPDPSGADALVVTTTADVAANDGVISLREAMIFANDQAGEDTITFAPTVFETRQTITLKSGSPLPGVVGALIISGPDAGVVVTGRVGPSNALLSVGSGASASSTKLFFVGSKTGVRNGGTFSLTDGGLSGSTTNLENLSGANATLVRCAVGSANVGVQNSGMLTVDGSTFAGITNALVNAANATATVRTSTFSGNAVGAVNSGAMTISNSTLSGNGDGVRNQSGNATVIQSTLVGNTNGVVNASGANLRLLRATIAGNGDGLRIGGSGTTELRSTLLVGNGTNLTGTPTSGGSNLVNVTASVAGLEVDGNGFPLLKPNGGPTATVALLAGSRAINTGESGIKTGNDQRGGEFPRVVNGRADIGAFEFQTPPTPQGLKDAAPSGGTS